jgi:anaerobic ribonucleoside-triphosphate reductase
LKVIKRDGRVVDYDRAKVSLAIEKANNEVLDKKGKASKEDIKLITNFIEEMNKKRILVEDMQDIIEEKLMELGKYELAKKYIVYRYTRALVRKSNTTDESILGLIRNENNEYSKNNTNGKLIVSTQRDYIAGEVSRDLTKRLLLPEKISKANEEGILYFHDADYFVQPIFNCCLINLEDMLDKGTVINGKFIETPKSFRVACTVMTQIIASVASNQYGEQSVNLNHLGKYLRKSKEKFEKQLKEEFDTELDKKTIEKLVEMRLKSELTSGVQTILYQITTLMTTNGHLPYVTLFLHLDKDDKYIEENAMIIEEILKQKNQGIKDEEGKYVIPQYPKLIYVLDECNCLKGGKYDYLTELAIKCTIKGMYPYYISAKKMKEIYEGNISIPMGQKSFLSPWKDKNGKYKFEGRFNQGIVSINLPQIAIIADGDENKFWNLLDERLELCKEALMCRHYALLGITSDISPIHWKYGAIARLKKGEKIDDLLYGGYSSISLGYIGIYEMTELMKGMSHSQEEGKRFALNVMRHLKDIVDRWKKETNIGFSLYGTPENMICYKFAKIDKERFGTIKNVTDKEYYTNSYHIDIREKINLFDKLKLESEYQSLSTGGAISYVEVSDINDDELKEIIKFIYDNIFYTGFYKMTEDCKSEGEKDYYIYSNVL